MRKVNFKVFITLIIAAVTAISFVTTGQVEATKRAMTIIFDQLNVMYNGSNVSAQAAPIVVGGRTYLPLRSIASLFNKDISMSQSTVYIYDRNDSTVADLNNQIASKDAYIQTLNDKINSLQSTVNSLNAALANQSSSTNTNTSSNSVPSIGKLENDLNDSYDSYRNANFEISLSGDKNSVSITFKTDEDDWKNISDSYQKKYLQNVIDYIRDKYDDADIDGIVKDGSKTLLEFTTASDGDIELTSSSTVKSLQSKLENKLENNYFGTLANIDNDDLEIETEGDTDELTFKINISLSKYDDEWDSLTDSNISNYMKAVYNYILDQSSFHSTEVVGYFYDTHGKDNLAKLYNKANSFRRYK